MTSQRIQLTTACLFLATFPLASTGKSQPATAVDASQPEAGRPDSIGNGAKPPLQGLLIDDFEDGDDKPLLPNGGWYEYDDTDNGGASSIGCTGATAGTVAMNGPGFESTRSLEVNTTFDQGSLPNQPYVFDQGSLPFQPYVGVGVWLGRKTAPLERRTV
jgi:hypothetical protein